MLEERRLGGSCGSAIAVSAAAVYWTDLCTDTLSTVPLDGGAVTVVDSDLGHSVDALTVDDANVYWATATQIKRQPLAGGATVLIATTEPGLLVEGIAVGGGYVYWSAGAPQGNPSALIVRAPVGGGAAETVAEVTFAGAIALDASNIYSVEGGNCVEVTPR